MQSQLVLFVRRKMAGSLMAAVSSLAPFSSVFAQQAEILPGAAPILAPSLTLTAGESSASNDKDEQQKRIKLGMSISEVKAIGWIYVLYNKTYRETDLEDEGLNSSNGNQEKRPSPDRSRLRFKNELQFPGEGKVDFTIYFAKGRVASIIKNLDATKTTDTRKLCALDNFGNFLDVFAEDKTFQRQFTNLPLKHFVDPGNMDGPSMYTYKTIEQVERQFGPGLAFPNWDGRRKWNLVINVYKYNPNSKLWRGPDIMFLNPTAIQNKHSYIVQKRIHPNDDGNGYHFYYKFRHERGCWRLVEISDPST